MIISALTLLMGLPLALEGNMGTAHTSGMWLYFQMYSMRMSLALALCNPRRHAPIMKRYMQAGIMIASVKHMWLGQESLPLQRVRSHWGKKKKKRQFSPLRQKCLIVMMCFYVTLFILTALLSSRLPRRRVVVTVFSRTKRLSLRVNQHSPRVRTFSSVSGWFLTSLPNWKTQYSNENMAPIQSNSYMNVISKMYCKGAICKNWSVLEFILQNKTGGSESLDVTGGAVS